MRQAKQRASALLSALFIMTLVAIAATAMSTRMQLDIYRTRMTIESDSMYLASQAVAFWAANTLTSKGALPVAENEEGKLTYFPKQYHAMYPGVEMHGALYDLQARFNLNNVTKKEGKQLFSQLLEKNLINTNAKKRAKIVDATAQWIEPYNVEHGRDPLNNYYLDQNPPYQPAHEPMVNVTEFRLIAEVDSKIYNKLAPYLAALPANETKININNAPKAVLKALGYGLSDAETEQIIRARTDSPITKLSNITDILRSLHIEEASLTVESEYFLSIAHVKASNLTLANYTLLHRKKDKKGQIKVQILNETLY